MRLLIVCLCTLLSVTATVLQLAGVPTLLANSAIAAVLQSPDARSILDKVSHTLHQMQGAEAQFHLSFVQDGQYAPMEKGEIAIASNRFKLQVVGITTWFDGKTQWTYVKANEEVNITEPDEQEQQAINPYAFLSLYKQGYKLSAQDTGKEWQVNLLAEKKSQPIWQMVINVDKNTQLPTLIKLRQANEAWVIIRITSMRKATWPLSHFTFTKADAPQAECIDLR